MKSTHETLIESCVHGDLNAARAAIHAGADPNTQYRGRTALNWAAQEGHDELVALLLAHGARPDLEDDHESHFRPLHTAAGEGHVAVVRRLLHSGADPRATVEGTGNGTALHLAAAYGHFDCAQELVGAGAVVEARDAGGKCAAEYAEMYGHSQIAEYLRKVMAEREGMNGPEHPLQKSR